jgi:hypothetical protein
MDDRAALSTELPAPRDDEPAGLRQDILDELADHLACSYNRELLRGASPSEAWRSVIERFGDPAAVARRLWLDAMRGKLMAQRILITSCLMMTAACFGVVGLVWNQSSRSAAQAAEANRRLAEMLTQTQATNQEMFKQLQAMTKPAPSAKSQEWIPVTFKLIVEKPDGPPAVGYEIVLGRGYGGASKEGAIHRYTDSDGLADFGVVQPGDWEYTLERSWGGTQAWKATGSLNAMPGASVSRQIICPRSPADVASVHLKIDWPSDLANKDLRAVALFEHAGIFYQRPLWWGLSNSKQMGWQQRQFVVSSRSQKTNIGIEFPYTWRFPTEKEKKVLPSQMFTFQPVQPGEETCSNPDQLFAFFPQDSTSPGPERVEFEVGEYSLERLLILQPRPETKPVFGKESSLVLSLIQPESNSAMLHFNIITRTPDGEIKALGGGDPGTLAVAEPYWRNVRGRFSVRPGQANEWTIPLPDEVIEAVRKRLKDAANLGKAE